MNSIRDAFKKAGVNSIVRGSVYWPPNCELGMPMAGYHPTIVMSAPEVLHDPKVMNVMVVLCTTSPQSDSDTLDMPIPKAEVGPGKPFSDEETCVASTTLIPLRKAEIVKFRCTGEVGDSTMSMISASVAASLGIVEMPSRDLNQEAGNAT